MWPWADMIEKSAQAAAADTGVSVVPWHDWKYAGHGGTHGRLLGTMTHDTVTPYSWSDAQLIRLLRKGYTGLPGPIANVGVGPSGNLLLVAAGTAYHAGSGRWPGIPSGNLNTVGIEVSNDGKQPWRTVQLEVVRRFAFHLHDRAGLPSDTHIGHKEWAPTRKRDPHSLNMQAERTRLSSALEDDMEWLNKWPEWARGIGKKYATKYTDPNKKVGDMTVAEWLAFSDRLFTRNR